MDLPKIKIPDLHVLTPDGFRAAVKRAARARKQAILRWRRARVGKKLLPRGAVLGLSLSLLALLSLFAWSLSYLTPSSTAAEFTYDELSELARQRRVSEAVFRDEDAQIVGTYVATPIPKPDTKLPMPTRSPNAKDDGFPEGMQLPVRAPMKDAPAPPEKPLSPGTRYLELPAGGGEFRLAYPKSDAVTGELSEKLVTAGARVAFDKQETKAAVRVASMFLLPLIILANLFTLLFSMSKSGGAGIGEVMTFGSIGAKRQKRGQARAITFDDVAGAEEAVAELREVRDYLADPEKYEEIGAQPPKGVLLFGPPGCGKTLLAKAVAGEAGVPFFSVAGAEFVESLVGVGAARVRDLFRRVRAVAPAIVFIDELDAAGRKRGTGGGGGGSDEREQTLNQLLVEMDGFDVSSGIVVMAATNRPDIIDPALMRPGRFDRHVTVDQPDVHGRDEILRLHADGKPVSPTVDYAYLARRTPGFTGADLANVVNEAALLTIREGKSEIEVPEFEEAIQRVLSGPKRRGRMLSAEERKRTAYHEAGHCVVAAATGKSDAVSRVSILTRSRTVGTTTMHDVEAVMFTKSQLAAQLVVALGGLAAEELVFGEPSTGAEDDLEHATEVARDMVTRYGMAPKLGRPRLVGKASDGFIGGTVPLAPMSGQTHHEMDLEIRRLLADAETRAADLIEQHRDVLDTIAARLDAEETIEGPELETLLALVRPEVALFGGDMELPTRPSKNGRRSAKVH